MSEAQFYFFAAVACLHIAHLVRNDSLEKAAKDPANAELMKTYQSRELLFLNVMHNWLHWAFVIAAARYFWLYLAA